VNPPLIARLRSDTASRHAELDGLVGLALLRSRESYSSFLQASLRAVRGPELQLEEKLGAEEFPALRAALLGEDLAALGADGRASQPSDAPPIALPSLAAAWGAAYVIEGSALGGQVLAGRVRTALGDEISTRYLSFRGAETGARWRRFLGKLAALAEGPDESAADEASRAALQTFDRYLEAFR
jgi:heme oxygenase